ncbi:leucine-rich repeat-containing protein 9-like [Athalia rosae]|uniref:leucine-rich repeat-containing protein 9-like n=1 Tax=Athalia rosae TaxID=37344 RepID=UPI0020336CDE|nr:leucine-rich repeat-containing protein 9-like [Athalia rosae]XP_048505920.1 leucine-rich repeat-containing protein 9-like [Athalia rosae]
MQHCGNIKFIEYLPDSGLGNSVVKICQNMCNNSLCTTVKRDLAIKGVHICRVVEIVNNETDALRSHRSFNEFSTMHKAVVSETDNEMVFRLLVKPVGVVEFKNWPFDIFEKEFFDNTDVIISGCLAAADADWAHEIFSKQIFPSKRACSFSEHRLAILVQMPLFMLTVKFKEYDVYHAMHSDYDEDICACLSIKSPEHVKPVFAVEFEYIFDQKKSGEKKTMKSDVEFNLESQYNPWRHSEFESVFDFLNSTDQKIQNLVVMNLSGQGICTIDLNFKTPQPNLRELDLSYNKLTALPDLKMLRYIRRLDISFNDIQSFEISTSLPMLESLDAAWNRICRFVSILRALETFSPNLTALNLKNNPFTDVTEMETMFALVRNALPLLRCFNEQMIDDFSLPKNGDPIHWIIDGFEKSDPAKLNIINNAVLRRRIISRINESLTPSFSVDKNKSKNVQYINLSDNKLSCLQFIDKYPNLKELYLENNLFMKIMLRKPLNRLTRLNLCSNLIITVDGIIQENLPLLNYLDLSNNLITSLMDLGTFHSLIEFYCSYNEIDRLSEIYNLKNWQNLKIVDLSNNPIDSTNACRIFIVFNLPKIEVSAATKTRGVHFQIEIKHSII